MQLWSVVGAIGRFMMRAGAVILLFVAYQLWGTGLTTARAQERLAREFNAQVAEFAPTTDSNEARSPVSAVADLPVPEPGDPIARLSIPAISSDYILVQGVDLRWLQEGPGHFPQTPLPGQPGNAAIAGHRTTYKAPFNRLDELSPGDSITVQTLQGRFTYAVDAQIDARTGAASGHRIVSPDNLAILDQGGANRLTLVSCHPKFTASQRIVVTATLTTVPAAATPIPTIDGVTTDASTDALAGGDASAWPAAILWSLLAVLAWFGTWWLARYWTPTLQRQRAARVSRLSDWRFLATYAAGTPVVLVLLFLSFSAIARLLPASY